jgi:dihydroorotate dehydrogenase (NAD+) catalytic subunit
VASSRLTVSAAGIEFQNPLLLAAGTAGYGREIAALIPLDELGGIVTKAVSLEVRAGAPAPRVAELSDGMINAVGLANPGVDAVRSESLPWLATHLTRARVLVNVVGRAVEDFAQVIERLEDTPGKHGYELNVSCPNVRAGGMEFGADPASLRQVVSLARAATTLPLFAKLSPTLPDIVGAARVALDAGADGLTLTNTMPGLVIDVDTRRPVLGFGSGGVSGPGLMPVSVLATSKVFRATGASIIGAGGIASGRDVLQYVLAGASAVAVGTAAMRDPRAPARILSELTAWLAKHGIGNIAELRGTLEWPAP